MRRAAFTAVTFALVSVAGASPARAQDKFALAMPHFNVQYVAGGMYGYWNIPKAELDLDADQIEDQIISQSFEPLVAIFERHPSWATNVEMQAYMLDVIAARHPALLDRLRTLAKARRIDVVSFHYSDQLYIAYPQDDWERSQDLVRRTFEKHDIPLSHAVFCQEGQAGPALAAAMKSRGYTTLVWPKNLWLYQHGEFETQPLYRFGDVFLIVGSRDVAYVDGSTSVSVTWTFLDDGELLATHDMNPYFPDLFKTDAEAVAQYEQRLADLEAQGYTIATVDQYVDAVKDRVKVADTPVLLDGTWQPSTTDGVLKWLGGKGLWAQNERDNHVRSLGAMAHRELMAAEAIAAKAGIDESAALQDAWRLLFLGQVSDATGINPFRGEVEYGIAHLTEALRIAREVINEAKAATGLATVTIDPASGSVTDGAAPEPQATIIDPPIALSIAAEGRTVEQTWENLGTGHDRVTLRFGPGARQTVTVGFPSPMDDEFLTTLALDDHEVRSFKRSDFVFDHYHFALPVGLIGPVPGRFIIKDQGQVHVAARIYRDKGDVEFIDLTAPPDESFTWVFHLIDGTPQEALDIARQINARRQVVR
jgi:hypothetical protein